jgi:hypothetical protein
VRLHHAHHLHLEGAGKRGEPRPQHVV